MTTKNQASPFIRNFAERAGLTTKEAHRLKQAFVHALQQEVMRDDGKNGAVIIQDLGTFYKGHRRGKRYYHLASGEKRYAKGYDYLAFTAAKCNRKYESDQGVFEEVARLETDGSVSVAGIDYKR